MKQTISQIIDYIQEAIELKELWYIAEPEWDFSTMQSTQDLESYNQRIHQKTWRKVALDRVKSLLRIIIYLDINVNLKEKLYSWWVQNPIDQIISHFSSSYIVEIRNSVELILWDWKEEVKEYRYHDYQTHIDEIVEQAKYEYDCWNMVIILSDFLEWNRFTTEDLYWFILLAIDLPIASKSYHAYYSSSPILTDRMHFFLV